MSRLAICAVAATVFVGISGVTCETYAKHPIEELATRVQEERSAEVSVKARLHYLISLPDDYDHKPSHALLLFLHGVGERGDNQLDRVKVHGPPKLIAQGRQFPCVVVSPQCPSNGWWDAAALSGLLDYLELNYKIDPKRIYVTGLSMGGYGTWALAMRNPDRFAAIAPICGGGNTRAVKYLHKISAPIWAFHGANDSVVPLSELQAMEAAQNKMGVEMKTTIYPDAGHDSWTNAYEGNDELFEWLFSHRRD